MANPIEASFRGSRRKSALGTALSLGVLSLGWWFTTWGDTVRRSAEYYDLLGWLLIVLFSVFGLDWLASLLVPHRLWVEDDGFSVKRAWSRRTRYYWTDIEDIFVYGQHGSGIVVWKNTASRSGLTRALFGCDEWLPGGWELSPEELASELNYLREHQGR